MFRITIEIIPFGCEDKKRTLYKIDGVNTGTDVFDIANYKVSSTSEKETIILKIKNFDRRKGILALTERIIKRLIKKERKE